ncbi:hypothetical protein PR048_013403 [Dryococelus australis]|uniref:Uncharacterized protein n=1 Tax=Dryococelus australis TaxID=614101 RepID=A0ABQ9HS33_9NEOP|nr:hypothetical protein PR048_013403 [Dryococelus australis]
MRKPGCEGKKKKQYVNLTVEVQSEKWKKSFTDFVSHKDSLGLEFFHTLIGNDKRFKDLWHVMKLCFMLSHGNVSIESGFSVNKSLLVENLSEESLVAQRIICDTVKSMGDVEEVTITRSILTFVRAAG